jgi:hypothetical protein
LTKTLLRFGLLLSLAFAAVPAARAADHNNLEPNIPTQVEDAYPIPYLGREVQGYSTYDRTRDGKDLLLIAPVVEYGFARNWQGSIGVPYRVGNSQETAGSGNPQVSAFYNFNTESLSLPAFAVSVREAFPGGKGHAGIDSQIKLIATKTLGPGDHLDELHVNLVYLNAGHPEDDMRRNRYQAILGYSRRIGLDNVLVTDFVRSQDQFQGQNSNTVELGLRHQVTPQTLYAVGLGAGISESSPKLRLTAGFQHSF